MDGTTCPACLQTFATLECVHNHLAEKSLRCAVIVATTQEQLSQEDKQLADQQILDDARNNRALGRKTTSATGTLSREHKDHS